MPPDIFVDVIIGGAGSCCAAAAAAAAICCCCVDSVQTPSPTSFVSGEIVAWNCVHPRAAEGAALLKEATTGGCVCVATCTCGKCGKKKYI